MDLIDSNKKFIAFCKNEIVDHFNKHADKMTEKITENDICVVWYFGVLNNYKALFKITTSNQYYEMTYDKNENRFYKDVYKKCESESEPVEFNSQKDKYSIKKDITNIMQEFKIPSHFAGYQYLRDAIMMVVYDRNVLNLMTKKLYPSIAAKFQATPNCVERSMRHAIEIAWERGKMDVICADKGKPTNTEFIAWVADKINLKYENVI